MPREPKPPKQPGDSLVAAALKTPRPGGAKGEEAPLHYDRVPERLGVNMTSIVYGLACEKVGE